MPRLGTSSLPVPFASYFLRLSVRWGGDRRSLARVTLVEREHELERIEAHLAKAAAGTGSALLIEGPPGIGKSALLDAARELAGERDIVALSARADELEHAYGFGVARQLLEAPLRRNEDGVREELLAGAARLAEGPLGLAPEPDQAVGPQPPGAELHGLYWLCANLADRNPLLLAIDDLHWADDPSLRFVAYLARRAGEHPLLICATSRPASPEVRAPLAAALGAIRSEVLEPRNLSEAGVAQVVCETLSADAEAEFCAACARGTGGNPFLLAEALAALRDEGIAPVARACGRWASSRATKRGSSCCASRSRCWRAPPRGSSTPARWSSWGRLFAAPASAGRRASERDEVAELMRAAIALPTIETIDPDSLLRALEVYERDRIDFAEAYLVALAEASGVSEILSFDRSIDRVERNPA